MRMGPWHSRHATHLLVLVGQQVDAEGEFLDASLLLAEIVDADLGVRDTWRPCWQQRQRLATLNAPRQKRDLGYGLFLQ